jgi:hypothetical protein
VLGEQGKELLSLNLGRILDWDATPLRDDLSSGIWPLHSSEAWALEPPFDLSDLSLERGALSVCHGSNIGGIIEGGRNGI